EQGHRVRGRQSRGHIKAVVAGLPAGCLRDRAAMGRSECTLYPAHPAQGPRASGQPITGTAGPTMEKIAHQANVARHGCAAVSQHAKPETAVRVSVREAEPMPVNMAYFGGGGSDLIEPTRTLTRQSVAYCASPVP